MVDDVHLFLVGRGRFAERQMFSVETHSGKIEIEIEKAALCAEGFYYDQSDGDGAAGGGRRRGFGYSTKILICIPLIWWVNCLI